MRQFEDPRSNSHSRQVPSSISRGLASGDDSLMRLCDLAPLPADQQRELLVKLRACTLQIRAELARMPATLEALSAMAFPKGTLSQHEAILEAIAKTHALWNTRDDSPNWEQSYNDQRDANANLALAAFLELPKLSKSTYAAALQIEKQAREQLLAGVKEVDGFGVSSTTVRRVEDKLRLPRAAIRDTAGRISAIDAMIAPLRDLMVTTNLRLVVHNVAKFRTGQFRDTRSFDYFQEGVLGLFDAIDRYDPSRNTNFTTYATWWIRQRLLTHANEDALIGISERSRSLLRSEVKVRERLTQSLQANPTQEEVIASLETPESTFRNIIAAKRAMLSPVTQDKDSTFGVLEQQASHYDSPPSLSQRFDEIAQLRAIVPRLFEGKLLLVMRQTYLKNDGPDQPDTTDSARCADLGVTYSRLQQIRTRGVIELLDYFILTSFPPVKRQPILERVLTVFEQELVKNLLSPTYEPIGTKRDQQMAILKGAHAVLLTALGESAWPALVEKAGLPPRPAFVVHHRIFGGDRTWRGTALEAAKKGLAPQMRFSELDARNMFVLGIRNLAPILREMWRDKEANKSRDIRLPVQAKHPNKPQ